MKYQNNLEIKILLKNIKKNNTIREKRNKTRQEFRKRREERDKKFEEVLKRNELNENNKKNELYKRQMSRDLKNLQKRYQILKPQYDEDDLYYNNKDIKNKKIGNNINVFSNKRRQHLNDIKNTFYKKNENLKIDQNNDNFIQNLKNVENEMKNIDGQKKHINKIIKNKTPKNLQTFNKQNNIIKNKDMNNNKNNIYKGEKNNNINNFEVVGKKYQFNVIDKKLDEKKVNNICFDGDFLDNIKEKNQNQTNRTKNNFKNNKNKKI